MTELEHMVISNKHLILVKDGTYTQLVFPYDEDLLFSFLNAVRIQTSYSGNFEKVLPKVEVKVVNSSEFKFSADSVSGSDET